MASVTFTSRMLAADEAKRFVPAVERDLKRCVSFIGGGAAQEAPHASGQLKLSLNQTGVDRTSDGLHGWVGAERYWHRTEYGTPPGETVPVGDGSPGSGLLYWVRIKKLAQVKTGKGTEIARRGYGSDTRGGVEGALKSVKVYANAKADKSSRVSRAKALVSKLEALELRIAYGTQKGILRYGVREQGWFRRSNPDQHVDRFIDDVGRRLRGDFT
jgi:hypothetical protein